MNLVFSGGAKDKRLALVFAMFAAFPGEASVIRAEPAASFCQSMRWELGFCRVDELGNWDSSGASATARDLPSAMSAPLFSGIACKGSAQDHWRGEWLGEHPYLAHPVGLEGPQRSGAVTVTFRHPTSSRIPGQSTPMCAKDLAITSLP